MNESDLKSVLLFLLQTLENHEHRIYDLQLASRALGEASREHEPLVWEHYNARLTQLVHEKKGIADFGGYDAMRRLIEQAKDDTPS